MGSIRDDAGKGMWGTYRFEEHKVCARAVLRHPALNHRESDLGGLERARRIEAGHPCVAVSER